MLAEAINEISIPVKNEKLPAGYEMKKMPLIYPHDLVGYLFNTLCITISQEAVTRYWLHHLSTEQPFAVHGPGDTNCVPLGLYGDGARLATLYKHEKLIAVWLNLPLYRPRSTRSSRWLLFSIMADQLHSHWTMDAVLRHMLWSFWALFNGEIPQRGPFGRELPPNLAGREGEQIVHRRKLQFVITEYRGDWEWHRDLWHFVQCSWKSEKVCWMCDARRCEDWQSAYWNLEENSTWANNPFTKAEFMAERQPERGLCFLALIHPRVHV